MRITSRSPSVVGIVLVTALLASPAAGQYFGQNLSQVFEHQLTERQPVERVDPHIAMWLRDAVLPGDIPSVADLSTGRYVQDP